MDTPTPAETHLAQTIDALGQADFTEAMNRWLQAEIRQDNCTILAYFDGRRPLSLSRSATTNAVHRNFEKTYVAGAYLLDPFHNLHVNRAAAGVYRLSDIAPDQFHRNPYFLDYYSATTLLDEIAFVTYPARDISLHICLGRDRSSKSRFNSKELATAHRIAPIVLSLANRQWAGLAAQGDYSDTAVTDRLVASLARTHGIKLSQRQAEVAFFILRGHSSVSIGLTLGVSPQTVKVFRKQLYRKCAISSQAELFRLMLPLLSE
ncbi:MULTISPECIES: helix-turn-helix transcriptional regulator [unclassified Roseovarius]|uniref:helix-turn-helix transcriptional regulator n=1 Tax=unclassified Roseovarius TaxID=2614913 RepID=UPI00273E8FD7|nr:MULTISPECIES: helix-turn-helix transcriptional regulator [unclassified Roseovarius]